MSDELTTENPSGLEAENPLGEATGAEEAYLRFVPLAQALPVEKLISYRGVDAMLALHNVQSGLKNVTPYLDRISTRLEPQEREHIEAISDLALAVVFASRQVNLRERSSQDYKEKMTRIFKLRNILLYAAISCAHADLIPMEDVERIQRGGGPADAAQDCIDLVALFRKNAHVLVGKTPATPELLKEAAELGTLMVKSIKPARAATPQLASEEKESDVDIRNRLWTLLTVYHESLWTAGSLLYKKEVGNYIPELLSAKRPEQGQSPAAPAPSPQQEKPTTSTE